ncbi:MAG TPA: PEP-CTERM sorting domain-containing protein, partial [Phycisphaerae bacterium]|nr:PEP-CTERM sorting domain-containing protein [Phycisphaerae bacterium]
LGGAGGNEATGTDQGGGGGGGGRVLYHVASYTAGSTLVLPSPQLNGAGGGQTGGGAGAFGSARLDVGTTIVPDGQVFTFDAPQVNEFTTSNVTVNAGGVAVTPGAYTNVGTVTVAAGGTFTGTGALKGGSWVLAGGPVTALAGFTADGTTSVTGHGTFAGKITSTGTGGSIQASGGALVMGDATVAGAFNYNGAITVGISGQPASLILLAASHAVIGNTTINAGSISAPNGTTLRSGTALTAATAASIGGAFTNNGTVGGPTAAGSFLTFTDDVNGAGNYTGNVKFSDGFSPGTGPADVSLENMAFDNTAGLTMELGGRNEGSQYDRLTISGNAALDGTLDVTLINGFVPRVGDSFLLLDGGTLSGGFGNLDLPALPGGEQWVVDQEAGSLSVTVAEVPEPATVAMVGMGMAVLGWRRRGKR